VSDDRAMIRFPGALGELLAARLDMPPGPPAAYALFAHCFTCSKDTLAASRISAALTERGIAVLRFDFTGLGSSAGDFSNTNFSSNIADLQAAAAWLREHHQAPSLLIGHSLGGAAVLAVAAQIPEAVAIATIAAPFEARHVRALLADSAGEINAAGEARVALAGRTFVIRKQLLEDLERHNSTSGIANLHKALLIFHSPRDTVVDIENATHIFMAAKHPKSFVSLDTADHLLTRREDAAYVAAVVAAWASRYLAPPAQPGEGEAGTVTVTEAGTGKFAQEVVAGPHRLRADEPLAAGGTNTGPTPYDLVLAGLGACTSMTIRLYAERKQWPLERVGVRLRYSRNHAQDCVDCEAGAPRLDRIDREIELAGDLDETQRARLLEIANKCPVHRTLEAGVHIPTRLKAPAAG
jgi:uncharacterized OsmC-like protein/alpha/beta superfamily hydrolase